jgi:hypothetical protein
MVFAKKILSSYQTEQIDSFYKQIFEYVREKVAQDVYEDSRNALAFLIDLYLDSPREECLSLINELQLRQDLKETNDLQAASFYAGRCLARVYQLVGLCDLNVNNYEANLRTLFYDETTNKRVTQLASFITFQSERAVCSLTDQDTSRRLLTLYSFLRAEREFQSLSGWQRFEAFLKQTFELSSGDNCKCNLDENYLIQHRLYGFERYLERKLADKTSPDDVNMLLSVRNYLTTNSACLYSILLKIDYSQRADPALTHLFWTLFEDTDMGNKMKLIHDLYSKREVKFDDNCQSVECLSDGNFSNDLNLVLNKLSTANFDNPKVRSLMGVYLSNI